MIKVRIGIKNTKIKTPKLSNNPSVCLWNFATSILYRSNVAPDKIIVFMHKETNSPNHFFCLAFRIQTPVSVETRKEIKMIAENAIFNRLHVLPFNL